MTDEAVTLTRLDGIIVTTMPEWYKMPGKSIVYVPQLFTERYGDPLKAAERYDKIYTVKKLIDEEEGYRDSIIELFGLSEFEIPFIESISLVSA